MHTAFLLPHVLPFLFSGAPPTTEEVALEHSVQSGAITISGECLGGHTAECIVVEMTNRTDQRISTAIPAGWLMQNSDPDAQDLMIVDRRAIDLAPHETRRVPCKAYCVESSDSSPQAGVALRSMGFAKRTWVKLAEHLEQGNEAEDDIQAAVWAVADDHDIAAIGADDVEAHLPLRQFVADLTGRTVPWYAKRYAPPTEEGRVFSNAPTSVHGEIDFNLRTNGVVTVLVHNARGQLMHTIGKDRYLGPGEYGMEVELTVQGWPHGQYTIQFFLDDSQLLKRLPFEV